MVTDIWTFGLSYLWPWIPQWTSLLRVLGWFGFTLQLAWISDALRLISCHTYYMYLYFARIHHHQLRLLSTLWKLFLGRKNNVLRCRVDSCEYDINQVYPKRF